MTEKTKKKVILLSAIIAPLVISLIYPLVLLSRGNDTLFDLVHGFWAVFLGGAIILGGCIFALATRRKNRILSNVYVKIVVAFVYCVFCFVSMRQFYSFRENNTTTPSWWVWGVTMGGTLSLFLGGYLAEIKGGNHKWLNDIEAYIALSVPVMGAYLLLPIWVRGIVLFWQLFGVR